MKKTIQKTRIGWVLAEDYVIAFDKWQATIYNAYGAIGRVLVEEMKNQIVKSKPDELNSWVDVIELAQHMGIKGYGTVLKPKWENKKGID